MDFVHVKHNSPFEVNFFSRCDYKTTGIRNSYSFCPHLYLYVNEFDLLEKNDSSKILQQTCNETEYIASWCPIMQSIVIFNSQLILCLQTPGVIYAAI